MSYKALLFCPDEKTARVVTQVLSELEFQVEPCNEPFAAVKKLVAEHFDALVVDCENEQNATLLFKSAHNSESNQNSLAVAVVEGQSGVAKAFRIGANLVLTKPINVEQSKGTLRVARGLLKKGESARATITKPVSDHPAVMGAPGPHPTAKPISLTTPAPPLVAAPVASSAFELEKEPVPEPEPTEAALLESMPEPKAPAASKQYPWQPPAKPMAEPMTTALKHAAQATGKAYSSAQDGPASAEHFSSAVSSTTSHSSSGHGFGAAAAPAKITPAADEDPLLQEIESLHLSTPISTPPSSSGGSKKIATIAAVVLLTAAAGYYGWTRLSPHAFSSAIHKGAPAPAPLPAPTPSQVQVQTSLPGIASPVAGLTQGPASNAATTLGSTAAPLPRVPEKAPVTVDSTSAAPKKSAAPAESENDATESGAVKTIEEGAASDALVVKSQGPRKSAPAPAAVDTAEPAAPLDIASGSTNSAISGLVSMPARVPKGEAVTVSQGVSQGLLIKKVPPVYPSQAMQMRIQGAVELAATIGKDGEITNLKVIKGDSILAKAAINAVKQWKYKPYLLNSQPVEIQTQVTVNFKLP